MKRFGAGVLTHVEVLSIVAVAAMKSSITSASDVEVTGVLRGSTAALLAQQKSAAAPVPPMTGDNLGRILRRIIPLLASSSRTFLRARSKIWVLAAEH